uniref:Uncharacterized protein n=1 Tax=Gasterosteus aculeatus TaxID=69293 RepID=G3PCG7_GASAC
MSEATPTSKLYITCEYASERKEKRDPEVDKLGVWRVSECVLLAVRGFECGLCGCISAFVCV